MLREKKINVLLFGSALMLVLICSYLIAQLNEQKSLIVVILPPLIVLLIARIKNHYFNLHIIMVSAFLVSFLGRLVNNVPFGLSIDFLLLYMGLGLLINKNTKLQRIAFFNPMTLSLLLWFLITLILLVNPLASNKIAWFYANRAFSIYPLLIIIFSIHFFKDKKNLESYLLVWGLMSLFGSLWGIKQLFFGLDGFEEAWLDGGAAKTHVLFGKLRVFSFYTDAAQFGASQAHAALVFGIISFAEKNLVKKLIYITIALFGIYGVIISGTRAVLAIIAVGMVVFLILSKNLKVIITGASILLITFIFLKFSYIGQSVYQINRMRTALNFDDPSFMIRINRINQLKSFMADKPLGYGIGTAGSWAKRFYPNGPQILKYTDGFYTSIWMQTGILGLSFKILVISIIILYLGRLIFKMEYSSYRSFAVAFFCAYCGFVVADFTNDLSTQLPSSVLLPTNLAVIYLLANNKFNQKTLISQ